MANDKRRSFGQGFNAGLSVVGDLSNLYMKTQAVFEDRAQRETAKQVGLQVQKQFEQARAPLVAAQTRIKQVTDEYTRKGQDVPDEVRDDLMVELMNAQGDFNMARLDIAMTTAGQHLGNKYVTDDMQKIASASVDVLGTMSRQAMHQQSLLNAQKEREHDTSERQARFEDASALSTQGHGQDVELENLRHENLKQRMGLQAGYDQQDATRVDFNDTKRVSELVDAELSQIVPTQWVNMMNEAGIEPTDDNFADFQRQYRKDKYIEVLSTKYPRDKAELLATPMVAVSQAPGEDGFAATAREYRQMIEDFEKQGTPRAKRYAAQLREQLPELQKQAQAAAKSKDVNNARAQLGASLGGQIRLILDDAQTYAEGMSEQGEAAVYRGQEVPEPTPPEPMPMESPEPTGGRVDAGKFEDVRMGGQIVGGGEVPVGATVYDDVEMDLIEGLKELGLLSEEEAKPQLSRKRVR